MTDALIPRGINVYDVWQAKGVRSGKRWLWRVRDSVRRTYVRDAFEDERYDAGLEWAKQELARLRVGLSTSATATVADVGKAYLDNLLATGRTPRHRAQVQQAIDGMIAAGATDMKAPLFSDRVQAWLAALKAKRNWQRVATPASPRLRNKFLIMARALVHYAMDRRLITHDPLATLKPWAEPKAARAVFTVEDLREMLDPERETDRWFLFAALAAYTGCRASEVTAVRWTMIDWKAGVVRLPPDLPGNKLKRHRRIPLQPELAEILRPRAKVGNLVIIHPDIAAMDPPNVTHGFQDYAERCGVDSKGRGPHALRHTVAALLTAMGTSPFLAMDYLGHATASVAKDYAAAAQDFVRDVATWDGRFYLRDKAPRSPKAKRKVR